MKNQAYYESLKNRLEQADHGEHGRLVQSASEFLGCTTMTIYRNLSKVGYSSDRKTRSDKGNIEITQDELKLIASMIRQSERANHKSLMPIKVAIEIAYNNGKIAKMYNDTTVARLMREHKLSSKDMQRATPHVNLKTTHPNEQWQFDPSICVLYYLKGGKGMAVMDKDRFYKNKPKNFEKIANERVFRYVVVDHTTGAFYCKYYLTAGENTETLFDFLVTAMSEKDRIKNPFEGVPFALYWDKGSANQSNLIKAFLDALGVKHSAHIRGNSRAKGLAEKTNDIIERHFEGTLYLGKHQIQSIDDLNHKCELWQRHFQSSKRYAHTRHGMPRFTAWRKITTEQLRLCPPVEVCKMLLTDKADTAKVGGDYIITYKRKDYRLTGVDNISIGDRVAVAYNPYDYPNIRVTHPNSFGEMITYDIPEVTKDEWGFKSDAYHANAMTDGHHHTAPLTQADLNRQELDEIAYGTRDQAEIDKIRNKKTKPAFDGEIDPYTYLQEKDDNHSTLNIPKQGKPLDIGEPALQKIRPTQRPSLDTVKRDEPVLPVLDFIKWFVKQYGVIDGMNERIRSQYADGIKQGDYQRIADQLLTPTEPLTTPQLKVV